MLLIQGWVLFCPSLLVPLNICTPAQFFSCHLSSTERNYDTGNRELRAVKLALEEWRHWLEGAEKPFTVWTNHRNLAYIQWAKRLNSHQARWALFCSHFNFTLTYCPGYSSIKPDALFRLYSLKDSPTILDLILPLERNVAHLFLGNQESSSGGSQILVTVQPIICLFLTLYIPRSCSGLLPHPGSNWTLSLMRQHFWWLTMHRVTCESVVACTTCATARPYTRLLLVSSVHCPSQVSLFPMVTLSSSPLYITFLRLPIL